MLLNVFLALARSSAYRPLRATFEVWRDRDYDVFDLDLEFTAVNLSEYLESIIRVIPYDRPINRSSIAYYGEMHKPVSDKPAKDTDLLITFYEIKGKPNTVMGKHFDAKILERDNRTGRPIKAVIFRVLKNPSTTIDGDLLGTVFEVMGISRNNMRHWIDPKTGKNYTEPPMVSVKSSIGAKTYYMVNTPIAHDFIVQKFGVETVEGVRSGIEMNQEGNRLWGKTYFGEVPSVYPKQIVGNATLALLESTGWYRVNRRKADWNSWNDVMFVGRKNMKDFAFGPPQLSMSASRVLNMNEPGGILGCSYDYKALTGLVEELNCSYSVFDFICKSPYYNPLGVQNLFKMEEFDFQRMIYDNFDCEKNTRSKREGFYVGSDSRCFISCVDKGKTRFGTIPRTDAQLVDYMQGMCHKSKCVGKQLFVYMDKEEKECTKANETLRFDGYSGFMVCPDPIDFCRYWHYQQRHPIIHKGTFDLTHGIGVQAVETPAEGQKKKAALVTGALIVIIALMVRRHRSQSKLSVSPLLA